ncbi:MAG: type IV secretory system conjugative DNA transfer family protein, partial [Symploca sp. SIO2G7]|nr:type IV secretory system conjugative DNA transfer family protein [Symploca sp. SIO2G7]
IQGKKLIVFGMDRERRDVVSPLLAAILHMIVTRNVSRKRRDPLVLALDELPTLYLPNVVNWLNESREDGLVSILGFQNLGQLESTYGHDLARAIFGASGTKFLFNPQENTSAETFSNYLGQEEFVYKQKSQNYSKGGNSRNVSEQRQVRKLFESSQFLKLKTGECILLNPHFESRDESYIPIRQKIHIQKSEIRKASTSKKLWDKVRQKLIEQSPQTVPTDSDLEQRSQLAEELLPMPESDEGGDSVAKELEESASKLERLL